MKEVDTEVSFSYWFKSAKKGENVVYYNGFLLRDREILVSKGLSTDGFPEKIKTAVMVWKLHLNGDLKLTQKKRGMFDYDYIATKV